MFLGPIKVPEVERQKWGTYVDQKHVMYGFARSLFILRLFPPKRRSSSKTTHFTEPLHSCSDLCERHALRMLTPAQLEADCCHFFGLHPFLVVSKNNMEVLISPLRLHFPFTSDVCFSGRFPTGGWGARRTAPSPSREAIH